MWINLSKRGQKVRNRGLFWAGVPPSGGLNFALLVLLFGHSSSFRAMENKFLYHKFFDAYLNYHSRNATKENQLVGKPMGSQFKLSLFIPLTRCFPSCQLYICYPRSSADAHTTAPGNCKCCANFLLISVGYRFSLFIPTHDQK